MSLKSSTFSYWIRCYSYNNEYILYLKRNIHPNYICNALLFISLPYLLLRWVILYIYEISIGKRLIDKFVKSDRNKKFQHQIAIVVISKNEGPYINEWIEYHKLVGVTKIYFYDNESKDNTVKILSPYIASGIVEYTQIKGKSKQLDAYNDAIVRYKDICRYMAFIDMDEYIVPTVSLKPIYEVVDELIQQAGKGAAGIGINWAIFGSSHLEKTPSGLIMDNFINRGKKNHWINFHIKTICNPRLVANYVSPHYPLYKIGGYSISEATSKRLYGWFCWSVEYKNIRINHYFTKSKEQFIQKRNRGLADRIGIYDIEKFNMYDQNDIRDESMDVYSNLIKENKISIQ